MSITVICGAYAVDDDTADEYECVLTRGHWGLHCTADGVPWREWNTLWK